MDPSSINKNVIVDLPIVSDCKSALENINALLEDKNLHVDAMTERKEWLDQIEPGRKRIP